ncbi:lysozyme inhibitor LprI family protein [Bergeriella denitrificans]|uniref:Lipoprotein n=1 Tax=Bergeriella denitrificans TaxID=494 RepID=A0A378UK70_BERDE|nr:lysozyme inhibitor LprI family protein [Bergeriella denitrificans]STZ77103.1 Lipoprotein [Bergeriella denitrificans]
MYKKLSAAALSLALLAACGDEAAKPAQAPLACDIPLAAQSVRNSIIDTLTREAKAFARSDNRQFIDADKVIAAATQLAVRLDNAQETREGNEALCRADLSIQIPNDIWTAAESGSPLIYGQTAIRELVAGKIMGSNLAHEGNTFRTTLRYLPQADGSITFKDNTPAHTAQILSAALLPYGVKSMVVIDGRAVSKEEAVKLLSAETYPEPPEAQPAPEDILENNAAAHSEGVPAAEDDGVPGTEAEILQPGSSGQAEPPALAQSELDSARIQNQRAEADITRIWSRLERGVQQSILDEQRGWLQKKQQDCLRASAQADNPAHAEYLQLQCDTRMTRERIQYLRSYAID